MLTGPGPWRNASFASLGRSLSVPCASTVLVSAPCIWLMLLRRNAEVQTTSGLFHAWFPRQFRVPRRSWLVRFGLVCPVTLVSSPIRPIERLVTSDSPTGPPHCGGNRWNGRFYWRLLAHEHLGLSVQGGSHFEGDFRSEQLRLVLWGVSYCRE